MEGVASSAVNGDSPSTVETLGDGQSENLKRTHYPVIRLTVTAETVTLELAEDIYRPLTATHTGEGLGR